MSTTDRFKQVAEMRQQGLSYAAIGRVLGVSRQCVEQMVHRERLTTHKRTWRQRRRMAQVVIS